MLTNSTSVTIQWINSKYLTLGFSINISTEKWRKSRYQKFTFCQ